MTFNYNHIILNTSIIPVYAQTTIDSQLQTHSHCSFDVRAHTDVHVLCAAQLTM